MHFVVQGRPIPWRRPRRNIKRLRGYRGEATYIPLDLTGRPNKAALDSTGTANCHWCDALVWPGGCAPGPVHVSSFERYPRSSPDLLAYPVPKAYQRRALGTLLPRCLGVACSASSPKVAQASGCSLTPCLPVMFRRSTCIARAASVPGTWTLVFLLSCSACVWVWVSQ